MSASYHWFCWAALELRPEGAALPRTADQAGNVAARGAVAVGRKGEAKPASPEDGRRMGRGRGSPRGRSGPATGQLRDMHAGTRLDVFPPVGKRWVDGNQLPLSNRQTSLEET